MHNCQQNNQPAEPGVKSALDVMANTLGAAHSIAGEIEGILQEAGLWSPPTAISAEPPTPIPTGVPQRLEDLNRIAGNLNDRLIKIRIEAVKLIR